MLLKSSSKSEQYNFHLLSSLGLGCNSTPTCLFFFFLIPDEKIIA